MQSSGIVSTVEIDGNVELLSKDTVLLLESYTAATLKLSAAFIHVAFHKYICPPNQKDADLETSGTWIRLTDALMRGILVHRVARVDALSLTCISITVVP